MGPDFVSTFWWSIWRVWTRFFHEIISKEWDLSDGEVWECVTIVRFTKSPQTCHTNLTTWSQNFVIWKSRFYQKRNKFWKFAHQKIKITFKFVEKLLNLINFVQILRSSIFRFLSSNFSKNRIFGIYQNHSKLIKKY